jgi:MerR HTH family regulatory protein
VWLNVEGVRVECVSVGVLAAALQRTPRTIRYWQAMGLLPRAPLVVASDDPRGVRRYYPVKLVEALREVVEREGFGQRRPSGVDSRQRERLRSAWAAAMASLDSNAPVEIEASPVVDRPPPMKRSPVNSLAKSSPRPRLSPPVPDTAIRPARQLPSQTRIGFPFERSTVAPDDHEPIAPEWPFPPLDR